MTGTYKVMAISAGCCESEINLESIEQSVNDASADGYEVVTAYIDTTKSCCSSQKSSIIILKKG